MKGKIVLTIITILLIVNTSLVSAMVIKSSTFENLKTSTEDANKISKSDLLRLDSKDAINIPTERANIKRDISDVAEIISISVNENVELLEDGTVYLKMMMDISSPDLVSLYKDSFGISEDAAEIDEEVPLSTTRFIEMEKDDGTIVENEIIEPVREGFYEGISEEQKHLFGFHVTEFHSSRLVSENLENNLKIQVEASAVPYVTDVDKPGSETKITLSSAPADNSNYFIISQMELTKTMLHSFSGEQIFKKSVDMTINFPKNANIIKVNTRGQNLDFGAAYLQTAVSTQSQRTIKFNEEWVLIERESLLHEENIDELFMVQYIVPTSSSLQDYVTYNYDFNTETLDDDPWSWSTDWDIISLSGSSGDVSWSVDVDLYLTLSGSLHVDLLGTCIYAEFGVLAGLEVTVDIDGSWSHTFNLLGGMLFSGKKYSWRGMQVLAIVVTVDPEAQLYVEVGGTVHVYINPEANFNLKAGGDLDFVWAWPPVHFTPIFEFTTGGSFGYDYQVSAYAKVRPSLGFGISLLVFGVIGPRITPTLYLEGEIGYDSSSGAYWKAELGFDLLVGIQFTPWIHWNWPDPIYHTPLVTWKGTFEPPDNTPPETALFMGPEVNGYVGPVAFFWFEVIDPGAEASGVKETKFRIPEATDNSWHDFNYDYTYLILTGIDDYHVKYYSVDNCINQETTNSKTIHADLVKPIGGLSFDGWYREEDEGVYTILCDDTHVYLLGKDEGARSTNARVWYCAEHESGFTTEWRLSEYDDKWSGWDLTFEDTGEWTVTWVVEDGVWNVVAYSLTFYVEILDYPDLNVDPKNHDFGVMDIPEQDTWTFSIKNNGDLPLEWGISGFQGKDWISINPSSGTTSTETDRITVTVSTSNLNYNSHYTAKLHVTSNGGEEDVNIELDTGPMPPTLSVSPKNHDFGVLDVPSTATWSFKIQNIGSGTLSWSIKGYRSWIKSISPNSGTTTTEADTITVKVDTTSLEYNHHYWGRILVDSNGGETYIDLDFDTGPSPPKLSINPSSLSFTLDPLQTATKFFVVENTGELPLEWNIEGIDDVDWIENVNPISGTNNGGDKTTINVKIKAPSTQIGKDYKGILCVRSNGGMKQLTINLRVKGPELSLPIKSLSFNVDPNEDETQTFTIKNIGEKTLQWSLSGWGGTDWIESITPSSGYNNEGVTTTVSVKVVAPDTECKNYNQEITLSWAGGNLKINIHLYVNGPSQIHVVPTDLTLNVKPYQEGTKYFRIKNIGEQKLQWQASSATDWITKIEPNSGTIKGGLETLVYVTATAPNTPLQHYEGMIDIDSTSDASCVLISLNVGVLEPDIDLRGSIDMKVDPGEKISKTIYIHNDGDPYSELDWKLVDWPEWGTDWSLSPIQGDDVTPEDDKILIHVSFYAPDKEDKFNGGIIVENKNNPNDCAVLPVKINTKDGNVPKNMLNNPSMSEFNPFYDMIYKYMQKILIIKTLFYNLFEKMNWEGGI